MSAPTGEVKKFARNPVSMAQRDPVAAGVLLTAGLVALAALRSGRKPDARMAMGAAAGALVFVAVAKYLPRELAWTVLVGAVVLTWQNADALPQLLARARARIGI